MEFLLNREELAWAAGLFDGEGCTTYRRESRVGADYVAPTLSVTQAGEHAVELLQRFQCAVGGIGRINGPYPNGPGALPKYYFRAGAEHTQAIVAMLWFKLGTAKKQQAAEVLKSYTERKLSSNS